MWVTRIIRAVIPICLFVTYTHHCHCSCGMEWKPPGCKSVSNLDLDYPQCCPQIVCPEETKDSKDYGARGNQDKSDAVSNLHSFILAL